MPSNQCSLDKITLWVLKTSLKCTPTNILSWFTKLSRWIARLNSRINWNSNILIERFSDSMDLVSYRGWGILNFMKCLFSNVKRGKDPIVSDAVIFVHGGAFCFCDSLDIMVYEQLLPMFSNKLRNELNRPLPHLYTVVYDIPPSAGNPTFPRVQEQVLNAYLDVLKSGRNIVAVIGDSAGGNLVINLLIQLRKMGLVSSSNDLPTGILISPWLDPLSTMISDSSDKDNIDYVTRKGGIYCASLYVGQVTANKLTEQINAAINLSSSCIESLVKDADQEVLVTKVSAIVAKTRQSIDFNGRKYNYDIGQVSPLFYSNEDLQLLPPLLTIAGDQELLYSDIKCFVGRLKNLGIENTFLVGKNDIHVYPAFYHQPLHRFLSRYWLGWTLFPFSIGQKKIGFSNNAGEALEEMARFLVQSIRRFDQNIKVQHV